MFPSSPLHDETVTIRISEYGPPDQYGVSSQTFTEIVWSGVNIQQVKAELLSDQDRNTSRTWYRVSGPPVAISTADTILWHGIRYRIDGEPDTRRGAGRIEHTSLRMYYAQG